LSSAQPESKKIASKDQEQSTSSLAELQVEWYKNYVKHLEAGI